MIFSIVANRLSPTPLSKLAGCSWVNERVFIDGLDEIDEDMCYRAMDVLLKILPSLQETVFFSVANLLNLEVDLLFFDTTSTYWETDRDDTTVDDEPPDADEPDTSDSDGDECVEGALRTRGRSKDHRRRSTADRDRH